jgi:hypothetical protein
MEDEVLSTPKEVDKKQVQESGFQKISEASISEVTEKSGIPKRKEVSSSNKVIYCLNLDNFHHESLGSWFDWFCRALLVLFWSELNRHQKFPRFVRMGTREFGCFIVLLSNAFVVLPGPK